MGNFTVIVLALVALAIGALAGMHTIPETGPLLTLVRPAQASYPRTLQGIQNGRGGLTARRGHIVAPRIHTAIFQTLQQLIQPAIGSAVLFAQLKKIVRKADEHHNKHFVFAEGAAIRLHLGVYLVNVMTRTFHALRPCRCAEGQLEVTYVELITFHGDRLKLSVLLFFRHGQSALDAADEGIHAAGSFGLDIGGDVELFLKILGRHLAKFKIFAEANAFFTKLTALFTKEMILFAKTIEFLYEAIDTLSQQFQLFHSCISLESRAGEHALRTVRVAL